MSEPVITKPYKTTQTVICGTCRGKKLILNKPCERCKGEGMLLRVNEGVLKLYTVEHDTV
jgi:DnaJ-class molecular chaperone